MLQIELYLDPTSIILTFIREAIFNNWFVPTSIHQECLQYKSNALGDLTEKNP